MKGNYNILSEKDIKEFESKYRAEKNGDNIEYIIICTRERSKRLYSIADGLTFRIDNQETGGQKHFKINKGVLEIYLKRYHDLNESILKYLNIYISIFKLQNAVNILNSKNLAVNQDNIERTLFIRGD